MRKAGVFVMANKGLTPAQAKLVKGIAQGKKKVQAGIDAGYGSNPNSTGAIVNETLRIPKVQEALQAELYRQGITLEQVIAPITRALSDDSIELQLKGHDRAINILHGQSKDAGNTTYNFNNVQVTHKDKYDL
jgi:hypothetical protein